MNNLKWNFASTHHFIVMPKSSDVANEILVMGANSPTGALTAASSTILAEPGYYLCRELCAPDELQSKRSTFMISTPLNDCCMLQRCSTCHLFCALHRQMLLFRCLGFNNRSVFLDLFKFKVAFHVLLYLMACHKDATWIVVWVWDIASVSLYVLAVIAYLLRCLWGIYWHKVTFQKPVCYSIICLLFMSN